MKLDNYTYYKTGGECERFLAPTSIEELQEMLFEIRKNKEPFFILGSGSNSLVLDQRWPGAVVSFHRLNRIHVRKDTIIAEAGALNQDICKRAQENKLAGLSWMFGLPGQIGATSRMNARCYGGEISKVISKVVSLTKEGVVKTYEQGSVGSKCFRGYKDTVFMQNGELIVSVELSLSAGDTEQILSYMNHCFLDRKKKGQFLHPSCGCVFKNDYSVEIGVPSGMLIEDCGLKGKSFGGAQVSAQHGNFIFNKKASSDEILSLSFAIREKVWQKFGVWLSYEMEVLGRMTEEQERQFYMKKLSFPKHASLAHVRERFNKKNYRS